MEPSFSHARRSLQIARCIWAALVDTTPPGGDDAGDQRWRESGPGIWAEGGGSGQGVGRRV